MDGETVNTIAKLGREATSLAELTRDVTLQDGNRFTYRNDATEYGRQLGAMLVPPRPNTLAVTTLTGFVDGIQAGAFDPAVHLIHVEDYLNVTLKERSVDQWGFRATHVKATHAPLEVFRFDYYYNEPARFLIALQVAFLQTEELLYLIRLASNLKAGNSVQVQDDGFSQSVIVKTGEVTNAEVRVKPRIKLIPLRTFPEASPVESEFLIRFQQSTQGAPSIALFDVDGKKWMGELMGSIKEWLADKVDKAFPIIA